MLHYGHHDFLTVATCLAHFFAPRLMKEPGVNITRVLVLVFVQLCETRDVVN